MFSIFTYFMHDCKLKRQEKKINDFQLNALAREEAKTKKAKIRGIIIDAPGNGNRELRIYNSGDVLARNVKVEWLNCNKGDGVYAREDFSVIGNLSPHNAWKVHLSLDCGHVQTMKLRYEWSDDYQDYNVFEEDLQL